MSIVVSVLDPCKVSDDQSEQQNTVQFFPVCNNSFQIYTIGPDSPYKNKKSQRNT